MRERMSTGEFFNLPTSLIEKWSSNRHPDSVNSKLFVHSPQIDRQDWDSANKWLHKNKDLVKLGDYYYTPASKSTELKSREIKMFIATRNDLSWDDFNDFAAMENSLWRTKIIESDWKQSSCTCPFFTKNYKCKHIIGISNRLRFTGYPKIPLESITIMPEERRKRGRPALAKGALIRQ